jgi:catechol 2,3-dioxygenase-like lactoylglutathione lyase family enzyme
MTDASELTTLQPVLTSISPQLFVADINASCDYFADKLGFAVDFVYGEPPFYAQVSRDNALLSFRHMDEPVFAGDIREREGLLSASITVGTREEIEELFISYQSAGAVFHQGLKTEPWGARTFVVSDPDGNLILFAGAAA